MLHSNSNTVDSPHEKWIIKYFSKFSSEILNETDFGLRRKIQIKNVNFPAHFSC